MTPEEIDRNYEFIIKQQPQFAADIQEVSATIQEINATLRAQSDLIVK